MVEIKLRQKYRSVVNGRFKGGERADRKGLRKRKKIGQAAHEARFGVAPRRVMVMGPTGKLRMQDAA